MKREVRNFYRFFFAFSLTVAMVFIHVWATAQVEVREHSKLGFQFYKDGKPYYVKGVGGEVQLDYAIKIGANSIRTWGIDDADRVLEEAQEKGLTVMLGLWLQHERHGFDYDNEEKVKRQFLHFKNVVDKYKDHPALLCWGIGNELDLQYTNPNCWDAVQDIAKYIHEVDPNHPTTTVTAGLDSLELHEIMTRIPDLDVYCINTYGDIGGVVEKLERFGWKGPYMITEWGPNGYWEVGKTKWDVSIEQNSTEKKKVYLDRYTKYIADQKNSLGSYAFLWGAKQEYTETWFGLFSKDDKPTEPLDALEYVFTGHQPEKPSPTVKGLYIGDKTKNDNVYLNADEYYDANIDAYIATKVDNFLPDTEGKLSYSWKVLRESTDKKSGGDKEEEASSVGVRIKNKKSKAIQFRAPAEEGAYRLFVTIVLGDKEAYANIPFYVNKSEAQTRFVEFKKASMSDFE